MFLIIILSYLLCASLSRDGKVVKSFCSPRHVGDIVPLQPANAKIRGKVRAARAPRRRNSVAAASQFPHCEGCRSSGRSMRSETEPHLGVAGMNFLETCVRVCRLPLVRSEPSERQHQIQHRNTRCPTHVHPLCEYSSHPPPERYKTKRVIPPHRIRHAL